MLFERGFQAGAGLEVLLGGSKNIVTVANLAQDPANLYDLMCGKDRKKRFAMSDSGDEHDEDENGGNDTNDPLRALKKNGESLLVDLPPSMKPIRVYTGPARDERGRIIRVANTQNEPDNVDADADKKSKTKTASMFAPFPPGFGPQNEAKEVKLSRPLKLPKRAPMPQRRPKI